jgi:hypothetical protein
VGVSNFSIHFQEGQTHYPPLFSGVAVTLVRTIVNGQESSITILLSGFVMHLSAADVILFNEMRQGIQQTADLIMFSEDHGESHTTSTITEMKFISDEMKMIICRDNRSSTQVIPMFQVVLPPIDFRLSNSDSIGTMILELEPYISYYNETTVNWDLILEPFRLKVLALLTHEIFRISLISSDTININLPATAVSQYLKLANEIKMSAATHDKNFSRLPQFWLENNLPQNISIRSTVERDAVFALTPGLQLPVFDINMKHRLELVYSGETYEFLPQHIIFPTFLSQQISIVKRHHRGGVLISFQSPVQFRNNLQTPVDIFKRLEGDFVLYWKLESAACCPVFLDSQTSDEFFFTEKNSTSKMKHCVVSLNRLSKGKSVVPIEIGGKIVKIFLIFEIDSKTATKFITIVAPVIGVSVFPVPLTVMIDGCQFVFKQGERTDILSILPGTMRMMASFSLDLDHIPAPKKVALSFKKITSAPLYDPILNLVLRLAVFAEQDETTGQVTLTFFVPVIFFNLTPHELTVTEPTGKHRSSVTVVPNCFSCWCTSSYLDDNDELTVNIHIEGKTSSFAGLDCSSSRTGTIYLPFLDVDSYCYGLRYDVSPKSRIACVTIAPLVVVHNQLPGLVLLQPVLAIPTQPSADGLAALAESVGAGVVLNPDEESALPGMTAECAFIMTLDSLPTSPLLCLDREQRTAFSLATERGLMLAELSVVDVGTHFHACLRRASFPPPLVIANCLPDALTCYHTLPAHQFVVAAFSTSEFALDEPQAHPAVHIAFAGERLHVSLLEDTDFIRTKAQSGGSPVFVAITRVSDGSRAVHLTTAPPEPAPAFGLDIALELPAVAASLIDLQTREFAVLRLGGLSASVERRARGVFACASVDALQLDDQAPDARRPVVLAGRGLPFMRLQCVLPPRTTHIAYASLCVQRVDVDLDASFLAGCIALTAALARPVVRQVAGRTSAGGSRPVSIRWLEAAPIYAVVRYSRGRPFPFVPSVEGRLLLPGVVLAHVSDCRAELLGRIAGEYKTAAFRQIIAMLGGRGRLMSTFGLTALIAQVLRVKLTSELCELSELSEVTERFDNRSEANWCFGKEELAAIADLLASSRLAPSPVIAGILARGDIGLRLRAEGVGVFGILEKMSGDAMAATALMEGLHRQREPRAFLENTIGRFDSRMSHAQLFLQKSCPGERIRMTARTGADVVCCTNHFLFVLDQELSGVIRRIDIADIDFNGRASGANVLIVVREKGKVEEMTVQCAHANRADLLKVFLASQKKMIEMFRSSLI